MQVLQELGGWETADMVRRYAHLGAEHLAVTLDHAVRDELAAKYGVALEFIDEVYREQTLALEMVARIDMFVPVIARRKVEERLRTRAGMASPRPTNTVPSGTM
jgi:hypothetical protein